ncbi:uncharacterized protein DS421_18g613870 [Arachis hypogaea]|nr:uncharacterized protein DS421_18g613870 [Arachis hypogaea]
MYFAVFCGSVRFSVLTRKTLTEPNRTGDSHSPLYSSALLSQRRTHVPPSLPPRSSRTKHHEAPAIAWTTLAHSSSSLAERDPHPLHPVPAIAERDPHPSHPAPPVTDSGLPPTDSTQHPATHRSPIQHSTHVPSSLPPNHRFKLGMEPEPPSQFDVSLSENMGDTGLSPVPLPNESTSIRSPSAFPAVPAPHRNIWKLASRGRGKTL